MPELPEILLPAKWDRAVALLRRYFGTDGKPAYTGAYFERLGGGGDRPDTANVITAEDIVSLSMLSISVSGDAALRLLEDASFVEMTCEYLAQLPTDLDLVDADPGILADGEPAALLWWHLRQLWRVGPTATSKLMARKRPRLFPVYDSVIKRGFGLDHSGGQWDYWHGFLNADGKQLHRAMLKLRDDAGLTEAVSPLRVLDVVVWMEHRRPSDEVDEAVAAPE